MKTLSDWSPCSALRRSSCRHWRGFMDRWNPGLRGERSSLERPAPNGQLGRVAAWREVVRVYMYM